MQVKGLLKRSTGILFLLCVASLSVAQLPNAPLPTDPVKFTEAIQARLAKIPNADASYGSRINDAFNTARFGTDQKELLIAQSNRLLASGLKLYPDVIHYLSAAVRLTDAATEIRIPMDSYLSGVANADSGLTPLAKQQFFANLDATLATNIIGDNRGFYWRVTRCTPELALSTTQPLGAGRDPFLAIVLKDVRMSLIFHTDSAVIRQASGLLDVGGHVFVGHGGKYDWRRAGTEDIYVELNSYLLDQAHEGITADSVRLFYKGISDGKLIGQLQDPFGHFKNDSAATQPVFRGYTSSVKLKNVLPNLDFAGGFMLRGKHRYGISTEDGVATYFLKRRNGDPALKLTAPEFDLDAKQVLLANTAMTLYLPGGDSLHHNAMQCLYDPDKPLLTLYKNVKNPNSLQPITDSYNKYKLYFEALSWNPEVDSIQLFALVDQAHKPSVIESNDYFTQERYMSFKGAMPINPIYLIYQYIINRRKAAVRRAKKEAEDLKANSATQDEFVDPNAAVDPAKAANPPSVTDVVADSAAQSQGLEADKGPIYADRVLKAFKYSKYEAAFENQLQEMAFNNLISYDASTKQIKPNPSLFTWARAALRLKDYDVIQIISLTDQGVNGTLNVKNKNFRLYGVESFVLSDSEKVQVRPQSQQVLVGENRNLNFGGLIYAGKTNLYGKGTDKFEFQYDNYKIFCAGIDSMKFAPQRDPGFDPHKDPQLTKALSQLKLEGVNGAVYLNKPDNKSSIKRFKNYPTFDCYTVSYVYWAKKNIQNGVYTRKRLNFELDPFLIDSLENFNLAHLEFYGEFFCGNIMPSFRDTLKPVSDNTYGVSQVFAQVPIYGGKGTFHNQVQMDGFGFHGKGQIDYQNSICTSDTFVFHFDSVMAITKSFLLPEGNYQGKYYPNMKAGKLKYKWYTKQDRLLLETIDQPILLADSAAQFTGTIRIGPEGVYGWGKIIAGTSQIEGDSINLSTLKVQAHNSTYSVAYKNDPKKFDLIVQNAEEELDIKAHKTKFSTGSPGKALVSLPAVKYSSALSQGEYDENKGQITLGTKYPSAKLNYFVSTDSNQHGLRFSAKTAQYSTADHILRVSGVDSLLVADAALYPDSSKLTVTPTGQLQKFLNARLTVDTLHHYHHITNAELTVKNRYSYEGKGFYPYKTKGVKPQLIELSQIQVLADTTSYAHGKITDAQNFLITDRIFFRETAVMQAKNRFLNFDGEVKIQSTNSFLGSNWIAFKIPSVNPDTVIVPIDKAPKNRAGDLLTVGLEYIPQRKLFYTNFFQTRRDKRDRDVLLASGGLTYDQPSREFRVGPLGKLSGTQMKGNLVSYDDELRITTSNGLIDFPANFPDGSVTLHMAGTWREDAAAHSVLTRLVVPLNLPALPENAVKELYSRFNLFTLNSAEINYQDPILLGAAAEFTDPDSNSSEGNIKKLMADVNRNIAVSQIKLASMIPPATLLLTDVRLTYNDSIRGFFSALPVGLAGIGGNTLNKVVDSKLEYRLGRVLPDGTALSDTIRLYLQVDEQSWVYFEARGLELRTISSEASYNRMITEQIAKDEKAGESKTPVMQLKAITEDDKTRFVRLFSRYLFH